MDKYEVLGCAFWVVLLCLGVFGGVAIYNWSLEREHQTEIRAMEELERRKKKEQQEDLLQFAAEQLPEVQQLIDRIDRQIAEYTESMKKLQTDLQLLGETAESDTDYKRWKLSVTEMQSGRDKLIKIRKKAYIAYRKLKHSPIPREPEDETVNRLQSAISEAKSKVVDYEQMMLRLESGEAFNTELIPIGE